MHTRFDANTNWVTGSRLLLALLVAACNGDDAASASATAGGTAATTTIASTSTAGSESAGTASESATTGASGASESATQGGTGPGTESDTATTSTSGSSGQVSVTDTGTTAITSGPGTTTDAGTTGTTADTSGGTDTGGTTGEPPCQPGEGGMFFSYAWVANTDQGSVSKINTDTMIEEARYYTDPVQSGAASPSRTSVSADGRFMVVSNRERGSITKIAANVEDCIDKNNDGMIQTSKSKTDLLPYLQEECILWTTTLTSNLHQWGPRATTFGIPDWNVDTCKYENEKIWVGYMVSPTQAQMARLNSYTGAIEVKVDIPNFLLYASYSPYGAAVGPDGNIWTSSVTHRAVYRVDVETLDVQRWDSPDADAHYGITVGADGRVWFANYGGHGGHGGVSYFDPGTETWKVIPGTTGNLWRSLAVDDKNRVWVSNNGGPFGCGLLEINGETDTITKFHTFPQCGTPVGVGLDGKGKVWMIDYNGWTWQMDPVTYEKKQLAVANVHYTYSDFTGSGLSGVIPQ